MHNSLMDSGWRNYLRRVPNDCALYYPGLRGGDATVIDYSGSANNATITGAIWKRLPSGLWYLDFDGGDDVARTGDDVFSQATFVGGCTYAAWVKIDTVDDTEQVILGSEARLILGVLATTDLWNFHIYDGASNIAESNGALSTGVWTFVVGTWDTTTVRLYVNGAVQTDTAPSNVATIDAVSRTTTVGASDPGGLNLFLDGGVALPRVTGRAWSASEILDYYGQERTLFGV